MRQFAKVLANVDNIGDCEQRERVTRRETETTMKRVKQTSDAVWILALGCGGAAQEIEPLLKFVDLQLFESVLFSLLL
jgi:hypothetical protein